ncbi:L,D-transpeptidase family protein [Pseudahrensia aquimaris]|uniref:L,D-transpeptidase family protein n=1 Tax=Pseudahrensia aquimaris TaxID=744461 RepID=A0ABW3FC82_9HYPH
MTVRSSAKMRTFRAGLLGLAAFALVGCQNVFDGIDSNRGEVPLPTKLKAKMSAYGMKASSPIMIRIFKDENVLEVWKQKDTGRYALLSEYEICKWSGKFGPKFKEGDKQAPEGFYTVAKHQLNPKSQYHLSFNMGFPNAYDRAHGRTGSHLMVHGACSSAGCYSMTDDRVEEIYALAREALRGGQKAFQIQAFPFRMTPENMHKHRDHKHAEFWNMLKEGYDHFEITRTPPKVDVCGKRYRFNTVGSGKFVPTQACPTMAMPESLAVAYTKRQEDFTKRFEALVAKSENREPRALAPMTPQEALPGINIIVPKPEVVEPPKQPEPTQTVTTAPATAQNAVAPVTATSNEATGTVAQ